MKIQFLFFSLLMFFSKCSSNDDLPCPPGVEKEDCICMSVYEPVCGCDQVTYSNSCVAACHDIEVAHQGACK